MGALRTLLTREQRLEILRILLTGAAALLFWRELLPLPGLLGALAQGLYPLAKSGLRSLLRQRRVRTEVFIVIATVVAMLGREYVAGSVLLVIILIAELIAAQSRDPRLEPAPEPGFLEEHFSHVPAPGGRV